MISFLKNNVQLLILLVVWLVAGMAARETAYFLIPLSFILLKKRDRDTEMIIGFLLIVFFADNRHHLIGDWALAVKDVAIIVLSLFVLLNSKQFIERSKLFLPFITFLLWSFILTLNSPDPLNAFQRTFSFALMIIVIPNYFVKELSKDGELFLRNIILFCTLFLSIGLILIFILPTWVHTGTPLRYSGLLGSPNGIGALCFLLIILIAASRYHYPKVLSNKELFFIFAIIIITVLLARSRNTIFSILIFLFFIRFYKISYLYGFIIVIVTAIGFQFINENLVTIINSLGLGEYLRVKHLDDGSGRLVAWAFAWDEIQRHFFIGQGFGFDKDYFAANKEYLETLNHQGGVHSSYLTLWLNTGLIGLILFMVAFLQLFLKAASINYLAIPAMYAILFSIAFESWAPASLSPFNIIFLLIITLLQYHKNETSSEKDIVPV